jgi:hypothetical protein
MRKQSQFKGEEYETYSITGVGGPVGGIGQTIVEDLLN